MSERCTGNVADGFMGYQCVKRAVRDGRCGQHQRRNKSYKLGVDLTSIIKYNILHAKEMRVTCKCKIVT